MAEAIILPVAKSILGKLASFTGDSVLNYVAEEIKGAKFATKDLKAIAEDLTAICGVLQDAEAKQYVNQAIKVWLRDLKSVVYDIDDLLDEVAFDALRQSLNKGHFLPRVKYYFSSSNPLVFRFHLSHKIKSLRERLEQIVAKKNKFGLTECLVEAPSVERDLFDDCAYVNKSVVVGRDEAKIEVVSRLLAYGDHETGLVVFPIVGIGGIGKTTLAKLAYDDVADEYFDVKIWACVSDKFDLRKLVEDIIKNAGCGVAPGQTLGVLLKMVQDILQGKKYFLVLDDLWVDDISTWADLKSIVDVGKPGSVILITTRNAQVASITQTVQPYDLDRLPDDISWSIFRQLAFKDGEERKYPNLCDIGRSIVQKCGGVPLVLKSIGSLLRRVRDEREWQRISNFDSIAKLPGDTNKVLKLLKVSYDRLPSHLKPCFAYSALIAKDTELYPTQLTYMWNALGILQPQDGRQSLESCGYAYATELVSRSLLQEPQIMFDNSIYACRMHDILHDLAVDILGEELVVATMNELNISEHCRHVVWGYEGPNGLSDKDFPAELLKAKKARSFRFGYRMNTVNRSFLEGIISNFSCLHILELSDSNFEELPSSIGKLKHLRGLKLAYNPLLRSLPDTVCELLNLLTLDLYSCEQLKELPQMIYRLTRLRYFVVTTCQKSLAHTRFHRLQSLNFLWFYSCKGLVSLWDNDNAGCLNSLKRLYIQNCPALTRLPSSMRLLVGLEELLIDNCEELDLERGEGLSGLQSLRSLTITRVPKMTCLPVSIQSAATSLQYLYIANCVSLTELPDCLQGFASLCRVGISNCPNLLALPREFRHLSSLQELIVRNCPHLSEK